MYFFRKAEANTYTNKYGRTFDNGPAKWHLSPRYSYEEVQGRLLRFHIGICGTKVSGVRHVISIRPEIKTTALMCKNCVRELKRREEKP